MAYDNPWTYLGKTFESEDITDNYGFIYRITNTTNGQMKFDTYWGFNGSAEIDFREDNFIKWHLKSNNLFDL